MATVMGTTSAANVIDVDVYARGEDGRGVKSTSFQYQTSTNGTTPPLGAWSTEIPTVNQGEYLWTKSIYTYSDDSVLESYNVTYFAIDGPKGDKGIYYEPRMFRDETTGEILLTFVPNEEGYDPIPFGNIKGEAGSVKFLYINGTKEDLPSENIGNDTFYFVNTEYTTGPNKRYDTYLYVNGKWEIIGNDLSSYATQKFVEEKLEEYVTEAIVIEDLEEDIEYNLIGSKDIGNQKLHKTGIRYVKETDKESEGLIDDRFITTNLFYDIS